MADFQYVIIGAGMMGAAAARHLSKTHSGVALIGPDEPADVKRHRGVFASHYDEARITRGLDADPLWAKLAKASIDRYRDIEQQSGISFYHEVGCLFFGAPSPLCRGYFQASQAIGAKLGFDLQAMAQPDLSNRFSMFDFAPDMIGLYEGAGAGHINPRRLVEAQITLATRQGVSLIRQTVRAVTTHTNCVALEMGDGSSLTAEKVLIAAGGFTNMNGLLPRPLDMRPTQKTVVFFELDEERQKRFAKMPSAVLLAPNEDEIVYILPPVRYPDGKTYLKIGGESEKTQVSTLEEAAKWFSSDGDPREVAFLQEIAQDLMPQLKDAPVTSAPCVATMTASHHPYIGYSDNPNVGILTGGNFVSAKSSDELGRLSAKLLAEGANDAEYAAAFAPQYRR